MECLFTCLESSKRHSATSKSVWLITFGKITSNMNERVADATPEELDVGDATCIICREEMTTAKKILCGHFFHVHCLRSWLERQNTCPTCRTLVVPPDNRSPTELRASIRQQGINGAGSISLQSINRAGVPNHNVSQDQSRIQAAASAAAVYEKSFVYPSPGIVQVSQPHTYIPSRFSGVDSQLGVANASDSQLDLQRQFIIQQIEVLQLQLQLLKASTGEKSPEAVTSDIKGKFVLAPSSSSVVYAP